MINITMGFHDKWEHMEKYSNILNDSKNVSGFEIYYNGISGYNVLNEEYRSQEEEKNFKFCDENSSD